MHHLKKWICMIAAAALLLSALPAGAESASGARGTPRMTAQRLEEMNGGPEGIHRYGGAVTLLEGRCTEEKITDPDGAARAVESMIGLIGGDERSRFEYLRTLTDAAGNRYYVFKQMYDNTTVLDGAVKVVTDPDGNMIGLTELADKAIRRPEEVRFGDVAGALDNGLLTDLLLTWLEHANEIGDPVDYLKLIGFEIREGEACELPAKGLEGIRVTEVRMDFGEEAPDDAPARKSRPAPRTEEGAPAETQGDGAAE